MDKILIIAKREFKANVKRKGYLLFAIIVPALFLIAVMFQALYGADVPKATVIYKSSIAPIPLPILIPSILGAIFSLAIFLSSGFLLYGVIEEKENRLVEILLTSVSPKQLLLGKTLGLGMLGITQLIAWIIVSIAAITIYPELLWMAHIESISILQILLIVFFFIIGYFMFAIMLAGIASTLSDTREASPISGAITTLSLIPSWAVIFFFSDPNSEIAVLLSYLPLTGPTTMAIRIIMTNVPLLEIIISATITITALALAITIVSKKFKKNLLVYAKTTKGK